MSVVEVALFTDDVEAGVAFYGHVLAAEPVATWPGGAIFAAVETKVLIHERAPAMDDGAPNEDHIAVAVSDLEDACATMQARGHALLVEPRDYPWGRSAYLRDPDGRLVELAQA